MHLVENWERFFLGKKKLLIIISEEALEVFFLHKKAFATELKVPFLTAVDHQQISPTNYGCCFRKNINETGALIVLARWENPVRPFPYFGMQACPGKNVRRFLLLDTFPYAIKVSPPLSPRINPFTAIFCGKDKVPFCPMPLKGEWDVLIRRRETLFCPIDYEQSGRGGQKKLFFSPSPPTSKFDFYPMCPKRGTR